MSGINETGLNIKTKNVVFSDFDELSGRVKLSNILGHILPSMVCLVSMVLCYFAKGRENYNTFFSLTLIFLFLFPLISNRLSHFAETWIIGNLTAGLYDMAKGIREYSGNDILFHLKWDVNSEMYVLDCSIRNTHIFSFPVMSAEKVEAISAPNGFISYELGTMTVSYS